MWHGRYVAVKQVKPKALATEEGENAVQDLQKEVQILQQLEHPCIAAQSVSCDIYEPSEGK